MNKIALIFCVIFSASFLLLIQTSRTGVWIECTPAIVCDEYEGYYCDGIAWVPGSSHELNCGKCKKCSGTSALNEGDLSCTVNLPAGPDNYCYGTTGCTSDDVGEQVCACNGAGNCIDTCGDGVCQKDWENSDNCPYDCPPPPPEVQCTDTDLKNFFEGGTCTDATGSYQDTCQAGNVLKEYYCYDNACVYMTKDCDDYDAYFCSISNPYLYLKYRDCSCANLDPDFCTFKISILNTWTCNSLTECTSQTCKTTNYYCFYSNEGNYMWTTAYPSAETACADNHDNDCDGYTDYDDPDCACTYSLSIAPSTASYEDKSYEWYVDAKDSSTCPSPINYTITYSTSGECDTAYVTPTNFSIEAGTTLADAFLVSVARADGECNLTLEVRDPNNQVQATGTYRVWGEVKPPTPLPKPKPYILPLVEGWNMISIPYKSTVIDTTCPSPGITCPETGLMYWDSIAQNWVRVYAFEDMKWDRGYLVYLCPGVECELTVSTVNPITADELATNYVGWNLIGSLSYAIDIRDMKGNCTITEPLYHYDEASGWIRTYMLSPFKAYWFNSTQVCKFG